MYNQLLKAGNAQATTGRQWVRRRQSDRKHMEVMSLPAFFTFKVLTHIKKNKNAEKRLERLFTKCGNECLLFFFFFFMNMYFPNGQ